MSSSLYGDGDDAALDRERGEVAAGEAHDVAQPEDLPDSIDKISYSKSILESIPI